MHIFHEAISFIVISAASRNCLQSPGAEPETKDPVKFRTWPISQDKKSDHIKARL